MLLSRPWNSHQENYILVQKKSLTWLLLEKTFGRDVAAERLRERVARLEEKQD
jgi:hypothetical protein